VHRGLRHAQIGCTITAHETRTYRRHPTEAHLIKGMLGSRGRACVSARRSALRRYGELPVLPTVWVLDDTLALHADSLIVDFLRGGSCTPLRSSAVDLP
jgi:hypothetical protein